MKSLPHSEQPSGHLKHSYPVGGILLTVSVMVSEVAIMVKSVNDVEIKVDMPA